MTLKTTEEQIFQSCVSLFERIDEYAYNVAYVNMRYAILENIYEKSGYYDSVDALYPILQKAREDLSFNKENSTTHLHYQEMLSILKLCCKYAKLRAFE